MSLAKWILEHQWVQDPVTGTWRKRPMTKGEQAAMGLLRDVLPPLAPVAAPDAGMGR